MLMGKEGHYYQLKKFLISECSTEFTISDLIFSISRNKNFATLQTADRKTIYNILNLMIKQGFLSSGIDKTRHKKNYPTPIYFINHKKINK